MFVSPVVHVDCLSQLRQVQLLQECIMPLRRCLNRIFDGCQFRMDHSQVDLLLANRRADVAGDVEVEPNSASGLSETDNAQRWAEPD